MTPDEITSAPPLVSEASAPTQSRALLPDSVRNPLNLLWIWALPQAALLVMNLRSFAIIWDEMSAPQKSSARGILCAEILLLIVAGALSIGLRALRKPIPWVLNWLLLALPVGYLSLVVGWFESMIPASVAAWILPPTTFLYYQFTLVMPAVFYAAALLAGFETKLPRAKDAIWTSCLLVAFPALWFAGFQLLVAAHWHVFFKFLPQSAVIAFFVTSTIVTIGALLRLLMITYVAVRKRGPLWLGIFTFLIALAGPLGGLWLNHTMPFPSDFQSVGVYVMAALNGLLLLLPNFRSVRLHRAVWLAQCALFPFTFYFFVVFLPFLPLGMLALFALGAGFLMLVPTALFLLHGQRLLDGFRHEVRDGGRLLPATLGALAIAALPFFFTARAALDRHVLNGALDYVYSPDYRAPARFAGSPAALERSLEHLRDFKAGLNLPFISDFYNWLVFGGLVLPDEKMARLHRVFFGKDLDVPKARANFLSGDRGTRSFSETRVTRPMPQSATLEKVTPTTDLEEGCARTRVALTMHNPTSAQSEFVAQILVPEGVLVSGFALHIGAETVPGRIFEKKTALWVYQKIRDVSRRDPGILLFTAPGALELRVFPFAANETRTAEIEFLYPPALAPIIAIGNETLRLGENAPTALTTKTESGARALIVTPEELAKLPAVQRTPYLHFIVDRSVDSTITAASLRASVQAVLRQFPEVREFEFTAANYECAEVGRGHAKMPAPAPIFVPSEAQLLPRRGGFAQDRAIMRVLLRAHDQLAGSAESSTGLPPYPIIVVIRGSSEPSREDDIEPFARLIPEADGFYTTTDGEALARHDWTGAIMSAAPTAHPVVIFKNGRELEAASAVSAPTVLTFADGGKDFAVLDASGKFQPLAEVAELPASTRYARGVDAMLRQRALATNPSLGKAGLAELVANSRATGVLVPATSFIVVENSAQWKTLEAKEKQKLQNNQALELQETPEPSALVWIVLGGGLAFAFRARLRRPARS